jgi:hypothetical protein
MKPDFTIMVPELTYSLKAAEIERYAAMFVLPGFRFDAAPII